MLLFITIAVLCKSGKPSAEIVGIYNSFGGEFTDLPRNVVTAK
jgi:hypothetical protein